MVAKQITWFKKYMSMFRRFYIIAAIVAAVGFFCIVALVYRQAASEFTVMQELTQLDFEIFESVEKGEMDLQNCEPAFIDLYNTQHDFLKKNYKELKDKQYAYMDNWYNKDDCYGDVGTIVKTPKVLELQAGKTVNEYEQHSYISNSTVIFEKMWFAFALIYICFVIVIVLLVQGYKQQGKSRREFLLQLPFSKMQWFFAEGIGGWLVTVGVATVGTLMLGLGFLNGGLIVPRIFMDALYLMLYGSCFYVAVLMCKEFVTSNLVGVILGTIFVCAVIIDLSLAEVYKVITPMTSVILIAICLVIGAIQTKFRIVFGIHKIQYGVARVLFVLSIVFAPVWENLDSIAGGEISVGLFYLLVAIGIYILTDLKFISQQLEKNIVQIKRY